MVQKKFNFLGASIDIQYFPSSYPAVAIQDNGTIWISRCTCQQSAGGKCCHVGCLLYLIEDLSWGQTPKYDEACTSKPQAWGKGSKVDKNPLPLHLTNYGQKRKSNKYYFIDPRPLHLQHTTQAELNNFTTDNQYSALHHNIPSNWDSIFESPVYEDYIVDNERKNVLCDQRKVFMESLKSIINDCTLDPLSTSCGVHIRATMNQSQNEEWFKHRLFRITASNLIGKPKM